MAHTELSEIQTPPDLEAAFDVLVCQAVTQLENGDSINVTELCATWPQLAPRLQQLLPALEAVAHLRPATEMMGNESAVNSRGSDRLSSSDGDGMPRGVLGDFRILRELGRGGMGIVYEAEQLSLARRVALKVLPFAAMLDEQQLKRFKNEARAAATLKHPHIVSVYSVGCDRGVHYYAMELVDGESLDRVIHNCQRVQSGGQIEDSSSASAETVAAALSTKDDANSPGRFRTLALLGAEAADALQHAHDLGIIHRDIKPGNLIIDRAGKIWITDFGLARIEADAGLTISGDALGTLRYMSPEQALGQAVVDSRSDIYSLGVTLYELLTLQPAYGGNDRRQLLQEIATIDPRPLRQLNSHIPVDLETIVCKATERDPVDRYRSAKHLADDLRRFSESKPIHARAPSLSDKIFKWSRRHSGLAWTALGILLLVLVVLSLGTVFVAQSRNEANQQRRLAIGEKNVAIAERNRAMDERNKALLHQYCAEIVAGQVDAQQKNIGGLRTTLAGHLPLDGAPDRRGWEWYYLKTLCHPEQVSLRDFYQFQHAAWSPDGALIGTPGKIWDSGTYGLIGTCDTTFILRRCAAWSPDSRKLAWGEASKLSNVHIWDRETNEVDLPSIHEASVWCLAWRPDGKQLATGSIDHSVKIWDVATRSVVHSLEVTDNVSTVAWSANGKLLVAGVDGGGVFAWNTSTGTLLFQLPSEAQHTGVSWHPVGEHLAVIESHRWFLLNSTNWNISEEHQLLRGGVIACSPDGKRVAVSHGETISVWDLEVGRSIIELNGHLRDVISLSWSADSCNLISSSDDCEIKVWDVNATADSEAASVNSPINLIYWKSDQTLVAVSERENVLFSWQELKKSPTRSELPTINEALCYSSDRSLAAVYSENHHAVSIVDTSTNQVQALLRLTQDHQLWNLGRQPCQFSLDGSRLVIATNFGDQISLSFWEIDQERCISTWLWECHPEGGKVEQMTWSPEGDYVSVVGQGDFGDNGRLYWDDHLHIIEVASGKRVLKRLPIGGNKLSISSTVWSPSSKLVGIGTDEGCVEIVKIGTQQPVFTKKIHRNSVHSLAWHPIENRLACSSSVGIMKIISATSGQSLLTFSLRDKTTSCLAWNPNGQLLAAATNRGNVSMFDASRGYDIASGNRQGELAWDYYELARSTTGDGSRAALREVLRHAPDTMAFWAMRGNANAMLDEFEQAADEFAKLNTAKNSQSILAAVSRALCLRAAGNIPAFQRECRVLASKYAADPEPNSRETVAMLCTATPYSSVDPARLLMMASYEIPKPEIDKHNSILIGACLMRAGQDEKGALILTKKSQSYLPGGNARNYIDQAYTLYFLALARHHLGHTSQARRLLAEANEHASQAGDLQWNWRDRVNLGGLRDEVTAALAP
ncbi:protein kinase domain-containing protein [Bythopirellula goksoeyrii]|uniref:Serine/threonine-protein kinase PrkC n=1 Tax=Bythopirellula goksoeyrii TaxID=1400387 RepID=A0A5B9Q6M2_9BACT|nr:protein kinase [Bythopirellula goksoeyrii]QEG33072.1 Serine/threonine-protein kinase PrkC [Bythopirellula goksoeyrii]